MDIIVDYPRHFVCVIHSLQEERKIVAICFRIDIIHFKAVNYLGPFALSVNIIYYNKLQR